MDITVADIMTSKVVTLKPEANLFEAHNITREQGIRHLPVVNEQNEIVAVLTQKALIANVMQIISEYGEQAISRKEKQTDIMNVADSDFDTLSPEQNVADVADFFLANKHGCLPVVDTEDKLIGIVTSSDFIKLSKKLLEIIATK